MISQAHDTVKVGQVDNGRDNVTRGPPVGRKLHQEAASWPTCLGLIRLQGG